MVIHLMSYEEAPRAPEVVSRGALNCQNKALIVTNASPF